MATITPSSKGSFPFHKSTNHYDSLIHNRHYSSSSSSSTFKTTTAYDPELYLGDDCDSLYETTLIQSGLLDWLQSDMDGFPKTSATTQDIFHCCATPRLEMILNHITNTDKKGKKTAR